MESELPKLYNAWFCPYAHRAWLAFIIKGAKFEYIEQNPYNKTPEWMSISPYGLVPAIIHQGKSIYESSICVEYIDEAFNTGVSIMPKGPYQKAYARIWGDFVNNKVIPYFFGASIKASEEERLESKQKFLDGVDKFIQAMAPDTTFFQQDDIGYVDILFAPWCIRWEIMKDVPEIGLPEFPDSERFQKWWKAVKNHPAVKETAIDSQKSIDRYTEHIKKRREAAAEVNKK